MTTIIITLIIGWWSAPIIDHGLCEVGLSKVRCAEKAVLKKSRLGKVKNAVKKIK